MRLRRHAFLGMTQSLCPKCLAVVPAKIVTREGRVYFLKRCPTHGEREDFVCSDVDRYDQMEFTVPSRMPRSFCAEPQKGLSPRLRALHRSRAAHVYRSCGDHVVVQFDLPHVLRGKRPGRKASAAG